MMNRWQNVLAATALSGMLMNVYGDDPVSTIREIAAGGMKIRLTESVTPENCRRVEFSLPSASMGRAIRVVMVLPSSFKDDGSETYPFLYALHGMGAPYDTWAQMSSLRRLLNEHPMILVSFDGDRAGWYIDSPVKKDSQFETFFFDELSPFVESAFRGNGKRAVTGFSMGGFGAFSYMLRRPDYFISVSSLSGAFRSSSEYDHPIKETYTQLLGPYEAGAAPYAVLDIAVRLKEALRAGKTLPPLFIACGAEDTLLAANRKFCDTLMAQNKPILTQLTEEVSGIQDLQARRIAFRKKAAEKQINYIYEESPGAHDWGYWSLASERVGLFHWKHFQTENK